jgi:phage-related protein
MIYTGYSEYKVRFYRNSKTGREPVREYILELNKKERTKMLKYIEFLREREGYLEEPYSKHIQGKVRELRVDFAKSHHRIFYFTFIEKTIILLHAFVKKTAKTPKSEIGKAQEHYYDVVNNPKMYG